VPMTQAAVLWIDGAGGTLIYQQRRLSVGSASQPNQADLPLLAPLYPQHLWIERDRESYVWRAAGRCRYQGREANEGLWWPDTELTLLSDAGREVCRLHLALPQPRLLTARLTWKPPARPSLSVHAAILVSTALQIASVATAHINVPEFPELWLYGMEDGWLLRCPTAVAYAGRCHVGELKLSAYWQIRIEGRHLALEPASLV